MKLAVILFGHYRTFDKHVEYWRGIDADFYISTWDTLDSTTKSWHKPEYIGVPLTINQIQTLKSFDKNCSIWKQEYTRDEMLDTLAKTGAPFKSFLYRYHCILHAVYRIQESGIEYDTVLITRPDIRICKPITTPPSNEIQIGYRTAGNYTNGLAATDVVYVISGSDLHKFSWIPNTLYEWKDDPHKYCNPVACESHFTDYIYQNWNTVSKTFEYNRDFFIDRLTP
jgi:hypothetical protein